ncbi:hypothetical protein CANMA_000618 [Candida margitis]|uniref:uncharacterized protein n=1 Tax=Candida margitis TaxID=1775924 RepID=UPI002227A0F5|nr:uncharacterized protein CANMA_000618 [Candida margitis]KAI5970266.1 hypothetical protein CANMA_000618 [Candida margitis]
MGKLIQVFVIGGLIRFLLPTFIPSVTTTLSSTVELSTPITSFKSLLEAIYFLNHDIDLYDGGVNHHPPLVVIIASCIKAIPFSLIWFDLVYTITDLLIAWKIVKLNQWYNESRSKIKGSQVTGFNDDLIACFYLFNPLIILTNLSHSTVVFTWYFIIESLIQIVLKRNIMRSMISFAAATYLSFNSLYIFPSLVGLALRTFPTTTHIKLLVTSSTGYLVSLLLLALASFAFTSSWSFLDNCYLAVIYFKKITPNVGLWWYLFTEMFEFFTPFYLGMFNLYSFSFILPIAIRLFESRATPDQGDSFLAVLLSLLWVSFTKSYPTVGDLGFALSLLPIFKGTILPYCKMIYVSSMTLVTALILSPIFYYCWIVLGNGNANFFYSINLIWGGVHILILMDLLWAKLIVDYGVENDICKEELKGLNLAQI